MRGEDRYLPHLLGHEGVGRVLRTGSAVSKVKAGDIVVMGWIKGEGRDGAGLKFRSQRGATINAGPISTFSTETIVAENRLVPLPPAIPPEQGVLLGCALPTGTGMVLNHANPPPGSSLGIFGLGGVGMSALMASALQDCSVRLAVDIEDSRLLLAKKLGATHTIDASQEGVLSKVMEITGGRGLDFCVEATGRVDGIELAFSATRRFGGLCVFASHPEHGRMIRVDPFELICGKRLEGSWGGNALPDRDIPRLGELYAKGQLPLSEFISAPYSLDQINNALDDLENHRIVRAIVRMDQAQ